MPKYGRNEVKKCLQQELADRLYQQVGQLKVELDWLKNLDWGLDAKRGVIDFDDPQLSVAR